MNTIKFSHFYSKLPRDYQYSRLLQVIPIQLAELSPEFRHYDTTYLDGGEEKQYPLPDCGDRILLLLQAGSGHGHLWTTIRKREDEKLEYYRSLVGKVVECRVIE